MTDLSNERVQPLSSRAAESPPAMNLEGGGPFVQSESVTGTNHTPIADVMAAARHFAELQQNVMAQMTAFWSNAFATSEESRAPTREDKRFADESWRSDPRFDLIRRTYLAYSDFLFDSIANVRVDEKTRGQLRFAVRQFVDAMSPANYFATNPEAIRLAIESGGHSVSDGMAFFFRDVAKGRISTTDEQAFKVGENLAVTEGAVVFENELIQVLQYAPRSSTVFERPFLIVPPCINKYYILDLQAQNSFVRYAVEQGHTVFLVSWRNITSELGHLTWEDYLNSGVMKAVDVALGVSGADKVNALGFCIGGTLLGTALAVMKARGEEKVASATLLTTMFDFFDTGEIGMLLTDQTMLAREIAIGGGGLMHGKELGFVFSALRANELIWSNVVNNYLMGKPLSAFDLLFWNADNTNLPGPMFCWYVRNTYLENNLRVPGKVTLCGVPIDVSKIDCPVYAYASQDDHIVPWRTAFGSMKLLAGELSFVLGASGHIAGVVNPASKNKRHYWTNDGPDTDADTWFAKAQHHPGSWWPHWSAWLTPHAGAQVAARSELGSGEYPRIEPAPGRFVTQVA